MATRRSFFGWLAGAAAAPVIASAPEVKPATPRLGKTVRVKMDVQAIRDKNILLSPMDYAGRFRSLPFNDVHDD